MLVKESLENRPCQLLQIAAGSWDTSTRTACASLASDWGATTTARKGRQGGRPWSLKIKQAKRESLTLRVRVERNFL